MKVNSNRFPEWAESIRNEQKKTYKNAKGLRAIGVWFNNLMMNVKLTYMRLRFAMNKNWSYVTTKRSEIETRVSEAFAKQIRENKLEQFLANKANAKAELYMQDVRHATERKVRAEQRMKDIRETIPKLEDEIKTLEQQHDVLTAEYETLLKDRYETEYEKQARGEDYNQNDIDKALNNFEKTGAIGELIHEHKNKLAALKVEKKKVQKNWKKVQKQLKKNQNN